MSFRLADVKGQTSQKSRRKSKTASKRKPPTPAAGDGVSEQPSVSYADSSGRYGLKGLRAGRPPPAPKSRPPAAAPAPLAAPGASPASVEEVDVCCGRGLRRASRMTSMDATKQARPQSPSRCPSELVRAVRGSSMRDSEGRCSHLSEHETHELKEGPVDDDFLVGWQLGKGSFGTVFVALSKARKEDVYAVKVVDLGHADARTIGKLATEVRTMRRVDHPNICHLFDCYLHEKKFHMVIEYCSGGELFDRITLKDHYSEREARIAFAQMVEAIGHCHQREVIHRDLKPENLLYAGPEGSPCGNVLRVCDFGLSTIFHGGHHDLHRRVGTPGYVAPEVLAARQNGRGYGEECDLWSLGVILYVMLSGAMPFYGKDKAEVYRVTTRGVYDLAGPDWVLVSEEAKGLVRSLLVVDPERRATPKAVFDNPWMAKDRIVRNIHLPHFHGNMRRYKLKRKLKGVVFAIIAELRFLRHLHVHDRPAYHRHISKASSISSDVSNITPRAHEAVEFFSKPSLPLDADLETSNPLI